MLDGALEADDALAVGLDFDGGCLSHGLDGRVGLKTGDDVGFG